MRRRGAAWLLALASVAGSCSRDATRPERASPTPPPTATSAGALRAALGHLVVEHVALVALATGAREPGLTTAAGTALDGNAGAFADLAGGEPLGDAEAIARRWKARTAAILGWAKARATNDAPGERSRGDELDRSGAALAELLAQRRSALGRAAFAEALDRQAQGLRRMAAAQARADPATAYRELRALWARADEIGKPIAAANAAAFRDRYADDTESQDASRRTAIYLAMGEHLELAAAASLHTVAGDRNAADAATAALGENTTTLSAALGAAADGLDRAGFERLWTTHNRLLLDYARAAAAGRLVEKDKASAGLEAFGPDLGALLDDTLETLDPRTTAGHVHDHVAQLRAFDDALARKDSTTAFGILLEAHTHMGVWSEALYSAAKA